MAGAPGQGRPTVLCEKNFFVLLGFFVYEATDELCNYIERVAGRSPKRKSAVIIGRIRVFFAPSAPRMQDKVLFGLHLPRKLDTKVEIFSRFYLFFTDEGKAVRRNIGI